MPYLLPRSISDSDHVALVLAFGKLSVLEACAKLRGGISQVRIPAERVCALRLAPSALPLIPKLAGIHKFAPIMVTSVADEEKVDAMVAAISGGVDEVRNLAVSGYGVEESQYETIVRTLLDKFRAAGFKKTNLLRPQGMELLADQVVSREALDIVAFPWDGGYGLGPTCWVNETDSMRMRGVKKPAPHSDISMSPRLAKLLLNLAGLSPGQSLLDPFCGSGTILAEALLGSFRCVGLDARKDMVRDTKRNLGWVSRSARVRDYRILPGDARDLRQSLGSEKFAAVVTEPLLLPRLESRPRKESAGALMQEVGEIYADALESMTEVLVPGGRVVIVVPVVQTTDGEVSITLDGAQAGLKQYQPGPFRFDYPVRPSFESTRWVRRAVYVFESAS